MPAEAIYGANVGMIERGGSSRFPLEALQGLRIFGQGFGKELQSYTPPQTQVLSFVDHTHTTAAQFADNAVMRNGLRNQGEGLSSPPATNGRSFLRSKSRNTHCVRCALARGQYLTTNLLSLLIDLKR